MTDDKMQPRLNDRPEPAQPKQSTREALQPPAGVSNTPAQPGQSATPGRRPLFRS